MYYDQASINLRLNYIYQKSLPNHKAFSNTGDNFYPDLWPVGGNDFLSAHTEEFGGYGTWAEPGTVWDNSNIQRFFFYGINESPWKKIRECTDVIVRVNNTEASVLTTMQKQRATAQAMFFRASRYFRLWKRYGGLPIVNTIQSTITSDSEKLTLPRTSSDSTFRFMMEDLRYAAIHLPARWEEEANDWGRITAGAAYALAGYIANYYASPVFNRADDKDRWQTAYELNSMALQKLQEGNFGLAYAEQPGQNAAGWAKIWTNIYGGQPEASEAVFFAVCNNIGGDSSDQLYNNWEQAIRPRNAKGGATLCPTAEMIDLFPMADGRRPGEQGEYVYDKTLFFLNRDPRFYRTFAFPGTEWRFSGSMDQPDQCPYANGTAYQLQNYAWYSSPEEFNDSVQTGYFTDLMGTGGQSVYVRKKSQDYTLNAQPLYVYQQESGFGINAQPAIYMRYTEVLLNFAEAACGVGKLNEAWDALIKIRRRVGYEGDCGLDPAIAGDRARMFDAILYERQIELAYEGKRFDDCHRWMLFDGGVGQGELSPDMALSAWSGNTCAYLQRTPLNSVLTHRLEMAIDPAMYTADKMAEKDPFTTGYMTKPKALTLSEDFRTVPPVTEGADVTYMNNDVKALAQFYQRYLIRKDVATMTSESGVYPTWPANCYFLGLSTGDQENNPGVVQEIGWQSRYGGMGLYNPVSLNPVTDIEKEK